MSLNESDTRAKLIDPVLHKKGWIEDLIVREEMPGTIDIIYELPKRRKRGKVDYILNIRTSDKSRKIPIAFIEAKKEDDSPGKALGQAQQRLKYYKVPFLFSSNGHQFVKYDVEAKIISEPKKMNEFPTMEYIANDYLSKNENNEKNYFGAISLPSEKQETLRHYQDAAIREVFYQISKGKKKCLLSLATGTGKTKIAVHIAKKLSEANLLKRVLFLCDRDELRTQALSEFKKFFGNDVASIKTNKPELNARILITTYQMMLSGDDSSEEDLNFYKKHFHKDFFSHIIIDECHRSAWNKWYKILEYNPNAIKIGLTATPREIEFDEESDETNIDKEILRDNIKYFGEPVFEYSLGQAVEDGYLPACEIIAKDIILADHIDNEKITGLNRAKLKNKLIQDFFTGREISIEETKEDYKATTFEKKIFLPDRIKFMCSNLFTQLSERNPFLNEKTIIFCARDAHSERVSFELLNLYTEYCKKNKIEQVENFAFNCTTESGGRDLIADFKSSEKNYFIACTCDLLSTGVDIPSLRNIVFFRYIKSTILFHQMLGRGQRIDPKTDKLMFRVYDYTNATRLLGKDFLTKSQEESDDSGKKRKKGKFIQVKGLEINIEDDEKTILIGEEGKIKKIQIDEYKKLLQNILKNKITSENELRNVWVSPNDRKEFIIDIEKNGLNLDTLSSIEENKKYDQYDLILDLVFNNKMHTRSQRADKFIKFKKDYLKSINPKSSDLLKAFVKQFEIGGIEYLENEHIFEVPEIKKFGGLNTLKLIGKPNEVIKNTKLELLS